MKFLRSQSCKRYRHRHIFAKKNHDRKVSRAISLATKRTKKFHQRFLELKPSTLRTSDEISSFSKLQEKSSPGKIFFTKILLNFCCDTAVYFSHFLDKIREDFDQEYEIFESRYEKILSYLDSCILYWLLFMDLFYIWPKMLWACPFIIECISRSCVCIMCFLDALLIYLWL